MDMSPENYRQGVDLVLRRAARWMALVKAMRSTEVLLLDPSKYLINADLNIG
jgi:hypothetical protein